MADPLPEPSIGQFLTSFAEQNFIFRNVQPGADLRQRIEKEIQQATESVPTTFFANELPDTRELRDFIPAAQTGFAQAALNCITRICRELTANRAKRFELLIDARQIPKAPDGNIFGDIILIGVRYLA